MSKRNLLIIKIIFTVLVFMLVIKELGVPAIVKFLIGVGIISAVWKYNPGKVEANTSSQSQELDKSAHRAKISKNNKWLFQLMDLEKWKKAEQIQKTFMRKVEKTIPICKLMT